MKLNANLIYSSELSVIASHVVKYFTTLPKVFFAYRIWRAFYHYFMEQNTYAMQNRNKSITSICSNIH